MVAGWFRAPCIIRKQCLISSHSILSITLQVITSNIQLLKSQREENFHTRFSEENKNKETRTRHDIVTFLSSTQEGNHRIKFHRKRERERVVGYRERLEREGDKKKNDNTKKAFFLPDRALKPQPND